MARNWSVLARYGGAEWGTVSRAVGICDCKDYLDLVT